MHNINLLNYGVLFNNHRLSDKTKVFLEFQYDFSRCISSSEKLKRSVSAYLHFIIHEMFLAKEIRKLPKESLPDSIG